MTIVDCRSRTRKGGKEGGRRMMDGRGEEKMAGRQDTVGRYLAGRQYMAGRRGGKTRYGGKIFWREERYGGNMFWREEKSYPQLSSFTDLLFSVDSRATNN